MVDEEIIEDYPFYYNDDGESVTVISIHKKTLPYRGDNYVEEFPKQYDNFIGISEIFQELRDMYDKESMEK